MKEKQNKKPKVYYITEYPEYENGVQIRTGNMSSKNKGDYIISTLNEIGYDVIIVSDSTFRGKSTFKCGQKKSISDHIGLVNFGSFNFDKGILRHINNRICRVEMFIFLLLKIRRNDIVIAYHGYEYAGLLYYANKLRKFNFVLEIEDIYHKVWNIRRRYELDEKRLLSFSRKNIVVSDTMKRLLNKDNAISCYGAYESYKGDNVKKINKDYKLIICTGSFDIERGTGLLALETIRLLPNSYQLKMSGTIQKKSEQRFWKYIKDINREANFNKCEFLGKLDDENYKKLLLKADIALNTQKEGIYSAFIFPSKIIKYLSYNLDVVSTPGASIIDSPFKNYLHITGDYTPESIADTIKKIDVGNHEDYRKVLDSLHIKFKRELKELLSE